MPRDILYLFGGDRPWASAQWETSDDRVRGGASRSYLSVEDARGRRARFHGHLDTKALGGAGFASQHSRGAQAWDLRAYEGIVVSVAGPGAADGKRYALTLKDTLPPRRDDGRERAALSWEAPFVAAKPGDVWLRWADLTPTYRGRPQEDAKPLDLAGVKRVGLMMRSYFGEQEGDFSLELHGIAAWRRDRDEARDGGEADGGEADGGEADEDEEDKDEEDLKGAAPEPRPTQARRWWRRLLCGL